MKKLAFLLLLSGVCSFAQTAVEKTKFTATIANRTIDTLVIEGAQKFVKKIAANQKGEFQDDDKGNTSYIKINEKTEETIVIPVLPTAKRNHLPNEP